jgi:hypothetical protein
MLMARGKKEKFRMRSIKCAVLTVAFENLCWPN